MSKELGIEARKTIDVVHERLQANGLSDPRLTTAAAAVVLGGEKVLEIYGASPEVLQTVYKAEAGNTPRTVADMESGRIGKEVIRNKFPKSRINEEETGDEEGSDGNSYHFDPLDGTSSYARGQRYSTVGNAVYEGNKPFAAAIYHPFEKELVVAQIGKGTHLFWIDSEFLTDLHYERQLEVSKQGLEGGIVYVDALFNDKNSSRKHNFMKALERSSGHNIGFRMSGSNIDQQLKVAAGRAEATLTDAVGGFFDLAAGGLAIIEAGGRFTDRFGKPVTESTQIAIGTNAVVYDDVREAVYRRYRDYQGFR
ncbi:MAG: inositol monophosphatase family protein [Patescibacteria group bacterium]